MNINYLALGALKHYESHSMDSTMRQRCHELYQDLRRGLMDTVVRNYVNTGHLWEQYDDQTGQGIRGHPFVGWTSLIVNIITEKY